jgi:peptidoglycan hydrolase-like protein with peptidoglycan-binding domain
MTSLPYIPETVTVHLGPPDAAAENVTVSFPDYIKNVASSEIYPTWPENAIRANVYAQLSYALNRIYTEYYRSRGYDFDITSSTATDQSFVYGRNVFDNISRIVDEIFDSYIRRQGTVEPLFAAYCDGVRVTCDGLSQWGTVPLAEEGATPYEILTRYYGEDIDIVSDVPVGRSRITAPLYPLRSGSSGPDVEQVQIRLNRISADYPAIPKISTPDGVFGPETEEAVREFQGIFGLTADGVVGHATWYRIRYIYNAVKRLAELNSEGLSLADVSTQYPELLSEGSEGRGVAVLQYYLRYLASYLPSVPSVTVDGTFGPQTAAAVKAFQSTYGLEADGIVGEVTWNQIYNVYLGMVRSLPEEYGNGLAAPFPGVILKPGAEGDDVRLLQSYLNEIARSYPSVPTVPEDGIYGNETLAAVSAFETQFGYPQTAGTVNSITWDAIASIYEDLSRGSRVREGQYPGYEIQ